METEPKQADSACIIFPKPAAAKLFCAVSGGIFDSLSDKHLAMIDKLTPLQIETRYPEYKERIAATLTVEYCGELLNETEGFLCWIKQQLEK
jgi:hypothetical protein